MRILGRIFAAVVYLTIAVAAIAAYGKYSYELMSLWFCAAIGSLFWIFKSETKDTEKKSAPGSWPTRREKILLVIVGTIILVGWMALFA